MNIVFIDKYQLIYILKIWEKKNALSLIELCELGFKYFIQILKISLRIARIIIW